MAPRRRRSRSDGRGGAVLPLPLPLPSDALYEILLRLPAKDLCRLRAVCQAWRSLLSDPQFIAAHAARHPAPLLVAGYGVGSGYPKDYILCDIVDLSGQIVKRVWTAGDDIGNDVVVSAHLDFVQVLNGMSGSCRLLNPGTGLVFDLPDRLADEHAAYRHEIYDYRDAVVFGKVASTGEYKVLRVFEHTYMFAKQLCEIFTLGLGGGTGDGDARWRAKKASPQRVDVRHATSPISSINGIAYFFLREGVLGDSVSAEHIAAFDLESEEWRPTFQGPPIRFMDNSYGLPDNNLYNQLSLASLNDCLAVIHWMRCSSLDLWYLMDFERGLWVKQHTIRIKPSLHGDPLSVHPLLVLNDVRIVIYSGTKGLLMIYNPRTSTSTDLAKFTPHARMMGLYTGSLLSLANGVR